ncbi:MAG: condensation domain-containing protein [Polyangiaceae bacterium]
MKSTLGRFLITKVLIPAAVINAGISALAGAATFHAGSPVPLLGNPSACGDTLVASFLMGFFTMIGVAPAARLEARAGRVRGFGRSEGWLVWTRKHVVLSAIALGILWVLLFGLPSAKMLQRLWTGTMPRDAFIAFKVAYALVFGVLAATLSAIVGLGSEVPIEGDPRWCLSPNAPVSGPVYPCDYMDKAALAVTSREHGCTGTPTWELRVTGALDPEHVKRALADVAVRYPALTTKIQSLDGVPPVARKYRYAHDPFFRVEAIFDVVEARNAEAIAAVTRERRSRYLDLYTDFPVTLTMVITGDDSCRLLFRQNHAVADGRAFIALLVDFAAFLNDARAEWRPTPEALEPVGRRGEVEALGLSPVKQLAYTLGGFLWLLGALFRAAVTPLTPLLQNRSNDYSGENGTVHWVVSDAVLEPWNAARKRLQVSLNTLLTGALMLANQRVHRARGLPLGRTNAQLLMETRPRDKPFVSFANHLTFLDAEANLARVSDSAALLRSIQKQVERQRDHATPIKRLLIERAFVLVMPLEQIQKLIFDTKRPAYNLNFSNLIPLEFAALGGEGWRVDDVMITTPVAPRHGIVLTVIRYGGKVVFNFNYKTTAATREQTAELCGAFRTVLEELTGASTAPLDAGG